MAQPRLNKAQQEILTEFGFEFSAPPEKAAHASRSSRYDNHWSNAKAILETMPGVQMKVRVYNSASAAYADAKKINNGEHRQFLEDGANWTAVAARDNVEYEDEKERYAIWLSYTPAE